MRDPYTVLGVQKSASAGDIKKAFRKLAKQYHPDQNKDAKAASRFAEVNSAYEILGEEPKRAQFDRGEIDAEGKPRFQGFEGFGVGGFGAGREAGGSGQRFDFNVNGAPGGGAAGGRARRGGFEDILSDLFGGAAGAGRASADAGVRGQAGMGADGRGMDGRGVDLQASVRAPFSTWALGGKARVELPNGRTLEVSIPAGIAPGKTMRLRGQGEPSPYGGEPGDVLIAVEVEPDAQFRQDGRNIRVDVPVTVYEAALGAKVRVPTLDGSVDLTLPPGTTGARAFRLKGKGIQAREGAGDLLVTPKIVLPPAGDAEFEAALRRLRDEQPYDAGRG